MKKQLNINKAIIPQLSNISFRYGNYSIKRKDGEDFVCMRVWVYADIPENLFLVEKIRSYFSLKSGYEIAQYYFSEEVSKHCPSDFLFVIFIDIPSIVPLQSKEVLELLCCNAKKSISNMASKVNIKIDE